MGKGKPNTFRTLNAREARRIMGDKKRRAAQINLQRQATARQYPKPPDNPTP